MSRKILILMMIMVILLAAIPMTQAKTSRGISGSVSFPAPPEWGVELDLWIDFDLREVNASTHRATGEIDWRMWNEELGWRQLDSHPVCVLFGEDVGEDADTVIVVTRIQQKEGWGDGLPGEYAYWWLRDDGDNDQMAILDYSYDPWYEFFPRGKAPDCEYFTPGLIIEIGEGLEITH
jgi:hypothetical protein